MAKASEIEPCILNLEIGSHQYQVMVRLEPEIVLMGMRNPINHEPVEDEATIHLVTNRMIMEAVELERWAFDNDPEVQKPITILFIECEDHHVEVAIGKDENDQLVPIGVRNAIDHSDVDDDLDGERFVEAIRMWQWAANNDPDRPASAPLLNINFIKEEGG